MTKPEMKKDSLFEKAKDATTGFLENDPQAQISELSREWAKEATVFIQKNPWAAVLGAAAIGYFLGSTRNRSEPRR